MFRPRHALLLNSCLNIVRKEERCFICEMIEINIIHVICNSFLCVKTCLQLFKSQRLLCKF